MKRAIIPVLAIFILSAFLPVIPFHSSAISPKPQAPVNRSLASALNQTTSESCSTVTPSGFGIDNGPFTLCGSPNSVSWGSPSGNFSIPFQLKFSYPSMKGPPQALQPPVFYKNSSEFAFNFVQSIQSYSLNLWVYFSNVSSSIYSKEIIFTGNVSGLTSGSYVTLTLPFNNPKNSPVFYNSSSPFVAFGNMEFAFGQLPSPVWNNQTSSLSFNVTSSSFSYDPIAIDNSGCNAGTSSSATNVSCTMSTSTSGDLVYAFCGVPAGSAAPTLSDASGNTWHDRTSFSLSGDDLVQSAYSEVSGTLSSDSIKCSEGSSVSYLNVLAFAVSGYATSNTFDPNAKVPSHNSTSSSTKTIETDNMSTTNANDMIIGISDLGVSGKSMTVGSGFTSIYTADAHYLNAEYKIVSSTQTNVLVSMSQSSTNINPAIFVSDAICQSGSSCSASSTVTLPFHCSMNDSASSVSVSISGGSPSPSSFSCDSSSHSITINPSTSYTLSNPSATSTKRYFLNSTSGTSCSSGTCSTVYLSDREQVNLSNPDSLSVVRSANSTTQNSSSASYLWTDYGTDITSTDSHGSFLFTNINAADYLYNDSSGFGFQLLSNCSASNFTFHQPGNENLNWNVSSSTSSSEVGIVSGYVISGNSSDYTLTSAIASLTGTGVLYLVLNPPYPVSIPSGYNHPTTTTTTEYGSGLSIPNQYLNMKAGESQSITVTLNNLNSSQTLKLSGVSVRADSSGINFSLGETSAVVEPYGQGQLNLNIQVYPSTRDGTYNATVLIAYTEGSISSSTSFKVTVTVGPAHTQTAISTLMQYAAYGVIAVVLTLTAVIVYVKREDWFE